MADYDVVIVGGGPAGLSAALFLGRSRRRTLLVDAGAPRNAATRAMHGFLSRDGIAPALLRELARRDLATYPSVDIHDGTVADVAPADDGFAVALGDGARHRARAVLMAHGIRERLPDIPGLRETYGERVFPCPYCDAWEARDAEVGALGSDASGLALKLTRWSDRVVWFAEGAAAPSDARGRELADAGVDRVSAPVARIASTGGGLAIHAVDGGVREIAALFIDPPRDDDPRFTLALGCEHDDSGCIRCDRHGATTVPGVYVAGDASRGPRFAITAAADGAAAAVAIDDYLAPWR